jgi:hypothetical protein
MVTSWYPSPQWYQKIAFLEKGMYLKMSVVLLDTPSPYTPLYMCSKIIIAKETQIEYGIINSWQDLTREWMRMNLTTGEAVKKQRHDFLNRNSV